MTSTDLAPLEPDDAYVGVIDLLSLPDASPEDALDRVWRMPVLAAHLLRLANADGYSGATSIDRLDRAALLLGCEAMIGVAEELLEAPRVPDGVGGTDADALVHDQIVVSEAAALMAQAARLPLIQEAKTAGLIHDIGVQLQRQSHPAEFADACRAARTSGSRLVEHERYFCRTDHGELAEQLLLAWDVPESVAFPVGFHHDPLNAPRPHRYLAIVLYAAECLSARAGLIGLRADDALTLEQKILSELRITEPMLEAYTPILQERIRDGVEEVVIRGGG